MESTRFRTELREENRDLEHLTKDSVWLLRSGNGGGIIIGRFPSIDNLKLLHGLTTIKREDWRKGVDRFYDVSSNRRYDDQNRKLQMVISRLAKVNMKKNATLATEKKTEEFVIPEYVRADGALYENFNGSYSEPSELYSDCFACWNSVMTGGEIIYLFDSDFSGSVAVYATLIHQMFMTISHGKFAPISESLSYIRMILENVGNTGEKPGTRRHTRVKCGGLFNSPEQWKYVRSFEKVLAVKKDLITEHMEKNYSETVDRSLLLQLRGETEEQFDSRMIAFDNTLGCFRRWIEVELIFLRKQEPLLSNASILEYYVLKAGIAERYYDPPKEGEKLTPGAVRLREMFGKCDCPKCIEKKEMEIDEETPELEEIRKEPEPDVELEVHDDSTSSDEEEESENSDVDTEEYVSEAEGETYYKNTSDDRERLRAKLEKEFVKSRIVDGYFSQKRSMMTLLMLGICQTS